MPDLTFSSKGSEKVLADQQRLAEGAKAMTALYKVENRELAQLGRDSQRIFQQTRTDVEKLQQQAEKLRAAIKDTRLSDKDREAAAQALTRVESKLAAIEDRSGVVKRNLVDSFGDAAVSKLAAFATGAGVVAGAMKIITGELRAQQELADKAAGTQVDVAASRNVVLRNLPGLSESEKKGVLAELQKIANNQGVSENIVNQAAGEAFSAAGGDVQAGIEATRVAAAYLADQGAGAVSTQAGALLDLSVARGTKDALSNQGFLYKVAGLSRPKDAKSQAQSIAPAVIGGVANGLTDAEAGALFASITTGSGDTTGQESTTAEINLAASLSKFTGGGKLDLQGLTTGQKLLRLQQSAEAAQAFLDQLSGVGVKQKAFVEELLLGGPNSAAQRQYLANLQSLQQTDFRQAGRESITSLQRVNQLEGRAALNRRLSSITEKSRINAAQEFLTTEEVDQLKEQLVRITGISSTAAGFDISVAKGFDQRLSLKEAADLFSRTAQPGEVAGLGDQQQSELREIAQLLREQNEELKRNTAVTEKSGGIVANGS